MSDGVLCEALVIAELGLDGVSRLQMWRTESVTASQLRHPPRVVKVTRARLEVHQVAVTEHLAGLLVAREEVTGARRRPQIPLHTTVGNCSSRLGPAWSVGVRAGNFEHRVIEVD